MDGTAMLRHGHVDFTTRLLASLLRLRSYAFAFATSASATSAPTTMLLRLRCCEYATVPATAPLGLHLHDCALRQAHTCAPSPTDKNVNNVRGKLLALSELQQAHHCDAHPMHQMLSKNCSSSVSGPPHPSEKGSVSTPGVSCRDSSNRGAHTHIIWRWSCRRWRAC